MNFVLSFLFSSAYFLFFFFFISYSLVTHHTINQRLLQRARTPKFLYKFIYTCKKNARVCVYSHNIECCLMAFGVHLSVAFLRRWICPLNACIRVSWHTQSNSLSLSLWKCLFVNGENGELFSGSAKHIKHTHRSIDEKCNWNFDISKRWLFLRFLLLVTHKMFVLSVENFLHANRMPFDHNQHFRCLSFCHAMRSNPYGCVNLVRAPKAITLTNKPKKKKKKKTKNGK